MSDKLKRVGVRVRQEIHFSALDKRGLGWCSSQWPLRKEGGLLLLFLIFVIQMLYTSNCMKPLLLWQANFSGPCLEIIYPAFSFARAAHIHFFSPVRKGFNRQRGNPAWRLFRYYWTFSWKTFFARQQAVFWFHSHWLLELKPFVKPQQQKRVRRAPSVQRFLCLAQKHVGQLANIWIYEAQFHFKV